MPNQTPIPPEHPPLPGSAPPNLYGFEDETGTPLVGGAAIIPLLELIEGHTYRHIGTGFFITSSGVFATAKHVLLSAHDSGRPIFTWQLIPPNQWHIRPVLQIDCHDTADVAIGLSCPSLNEETGEELVDVRTRLTIRPHIPGDVIATFAYPSTIIEATESGLPCGNLSRRDFQRFRSGQFLNAVDMQENQCGHDSYPLISVYERMVLSDVKVIGGGHGSEVPM